MLYQNGKLVAFSKVSASNISGNGVHLESISIVTPPKKLIYLIGEAFNPSGIEVLATFSNGYTFLVENSTLVFKLADLLEIGTEDVTVSFEWGTETASTLQKISVVDQLNWWSPKMTSDVTPAPFKSYASNFYSDGSYSYNSYYAFDGFVPNSTINDSWVSILNPPTDTWLMINFGEQKSFYGVRLKNRINNIGLRQFPKTVYVEVSNDGTTFETIYKKIDIPVQTVGGIWVITAEFDNEVSARYVKFSHLTDGGVYNSYVAIADVEFLTASENQELSQDIYSDSKTIDLTSTIQVTPTTATSSNVIHEN